MKPKVDRIMNWGKYWTTGAMMMVGLISKEMLNITRIIQISVFWQTQVKKNIATMQVIWQTTMMIYLLLKVC